MKKINEVSDNAGAGSTGKHEKVLTTVKKTMIICAILISLTKTKSSIFVMAAKSGKDYIPRRLSEFSEWETNFVDKVNVFKAGWGWDADTTAEWDLLTNTPGKKRLRWIADYAPVATGDFKQSEEDKMLISRRLYESGNPTDPDDTSLRIFVDRYLRKNKKVTVDQKREMGLTVPDTVKTIVVPDNKKMAKGSDLTSGIKKYAHLSHTIGVTNLGKETLELEPEVEEISVFVAFTASDVKVAPPLSAFQYEGKIVRGTCTINFTEDKEGMRAWYIVRKKIKGKYGVPSKAMSAVIP